MYPEKFYDFAQFIYQLGNIRDDEQEAARRSIIHLAYYTAYHVCIKFLKSENNSFNSSKKIHHHQVSTELTQYSGSHKLLISAKKNYPALLELRADADYKLSKKITYVEAQRAIKKLEFILKEKE